MVFPVTIGCLEKFYFTLNCLEPSLPLVNIMLTVITCLYIRNLSHWKKKMTLKLERLVYRAVKVTHANSFWVVGASFLVAMFAHMLVSWTFLGLALCLTGCKYRLLGVF